MPFYDNQSHIGPQFLHQLKGPQEATTIIAGRCAFDRNPRSESQIVGNIGSQSSQQAVRTMQRFLNDWFFYFGWYH